MSFRINRPLALALGISLAAHIILLLEVRRILPAVPEAPTTAIRASMKRVGSEAGPPGTAPSQPPAVLRQKLLGKTEQKNSHAGVLAVPDSKLADRRPETSSPAPLSSTRTPSGTVADAAKGSLLRETQIPRTAPDATSQEGVNADDIRQYRTLLAISARRFKRYPVQARDQGREGSVEIAIDFRRLLPEPEISIARSSGYAVLDEQALEMIGQAARQTDLPGRLQGRDFRVILPVTVRLDEGR